MSGSSVQSRPELRALTSIRGIAAWAVVFYHIRRSIDGLPANWVEALGKGYLAVDFFFLLSGFVIWMSWADRLRADGLAIVPEFLKRRIARIWPLHLFMLGGAAVMELALALVGRHDPLRFPFAELPLHVALLQNWGFTDRLTWNDPAWSISCELAAYLLFPLLALSIDWRRVPSVAVIAAIAALCVLLHATMRAAGAQTLGWNIVHLGLVRCLIEFTAGTAVHALWARWRERWHVPAALSTFTAVLFGWSWASGMLPETLAVPPAFAAALLALALTSAKPRNPLEWGPLHGLGEISYATYLGHFLLWHAFKLAMVDDAAHVPWVMIGLYLTLVAGSSVALYLLVERPAQKWINGLKLLPETGRGTKPHSGLVEGPHHRASGLWRGPSTTRFASGSPPRSGEDRLTPPLPVLPAAPRSPHD